MATKHECDICGAEVGSRSELWNVEFSPAELMTGLPDKRRHERYECCASCKRKAYVALMEAGK